jgi:hypothetical protein
VIGDVRLHNGHRVPRNNAWQMTHSVRRWLTSGT